ncbi:MAG: fucose isomerase [Armatimonadetes bacterium]|nr:fucose isomerase [Armatimonadota bacterium]
MIGAERRVVRVGLVPVVRPIFRGAHMGLEEASRRSLEALSERLGFALVYIGAPVTDASEAESRAAEVAALHSGGGLDFLLALHVTFATGDLVRPLLGLDMPLGLWALPEAAVDGPLPQNALCGLNLGLSLRTGRRTPVKWFYGSPDERAFQERLGITMRAMRGCRAVREGRVLWVGGTAPGFYRLETVPELPLRIDRAPLEVLFDALSQVDEAGVTHRLAEMDEPLDMPREDLRSTIRLEIALERLAEGYDGVALRCWPEVPERAGTMACAAFARLADRGCPYACEGDLAGLASMLAVAAVTGGPAALLDLSHADDEGLMFWHCGNTARSWADGATRLVPHFNRGLPAVRDMRLAPGQVCGLRFLESRKAAVYAGAVLGRARGYDGAAGWIGHLRWAGEPASPSGFLASVLNRRLPHHLAWGRGDEEEALLEMCSWLGHEPLPLDPEDRLLRWTSDAP